MKYIGRKATIADCCVGTDKHDLLTVQGRHIDLQRLHCYTKVLDWSEVAELLDKQGFHNKKKVEQYGNVNMLQIRYAMEENIPHTLDNVIVVEYLFDKHIRTVSDSTGKILDSDVSEIRKAILSPEEIAIELQRERHKKD